VLVTRPADADRLARALTSSVSRPSGRSQNGGSGPFRRSRDFGEFERDPAARTPRGGISRLRIATLPAELVTARLLQKALLQNEADVAVIHGAAFNPDLLRTVRGLRVERLRAWEITWALWLNPRARWLNDPTLRRWLVSAMDREALLDLALAGQGDLVEGLVLDEAAGSIVEARRPLSPESRPRLELLFDEDEPGGAPIAARLKAELDARGFDIVLIHRRGEEFLRRIAAGTYSMVLLSHTASAGDPWAALSATLSAIHPRPEELNRALSESRYLEDPRELVGLARRVEHALVLDGRLTTLVRTRAWRLIGPGLRARRVSGADHLGLLRARLEPMGRPVFSP
jgi:hypothetical protein